MDMKQVELQRRARIMRMLEADPKAKQMLEEYRAGRRWFERATGWMPPGLHSKWWYFPGMAYLIHNRMLTLICENMKFIDEDGEADK